MSAAVTPVEPKPAASVVLVRPSPPGAPEPIEVYMIRRQRSMKFLGGFYAFPGGKVDPADGSPAALARCRGLDTVEAEAILLGSNDTPALAFWVAAVRELLEESGVLLACDATGRPLDAREPAVASRIEGCRKALMAGEPRLFTEETSEGFWIHPGHGYRRFLTGEMQMAEPAEYGLAWVAQFHSIEELWAAHADGRPKFHGIIDRLDASWESFDWKQNRFPN